MTFIVTLPIKVNANARGHSRYQPKVKTHRGAAELAVRAAWRRFANRGEAAILAKGLVITITRIAPRELDGHDNIRTSLKPVVDGITDALGLKNDRDPRLLWEYGQRRAGVREYAVEIEVGPMIADVTAEAPRG